MIKICKTCGIEFDASGNLHKRINCLKCSPPYTKRKNTLQDKEKMCFGCNSILPNTEDFFSKDGKYLSSMCRECRRKEENRRDIERKILDLKLYGDDKCQLCGYNECLAAMTFHHLDPNTKDGQVPRMSIEKRTKEIKKCILVCERCHQEIHYGLHPKILQITYSTIPSTVINRNKARQYKQERIDYLGGQCIDCGYHKCLGSLNFHHKIESEKLFGIGEKSLAKLQNIKEELDKCIILCSNCHHRKHSTERSILIVQCD